MDEFVECVLFIADYQLNICIENIPFLFDPENNTFAIQK